MMADWTLDDASGIPAGWTVKTLGPVPHFDWNGNRLVKMTGDDARKDYTVVTDSTTAWGAAGAETWYVADSDVTVTGDITVAGDVRLILCDNRTLTVNRLGGGSGIRAKSVVEIDGDETEVVATADSDGQGYGICAEEDTVSINGSVTASGGARAVNGDVKNGILGAGWENADGTGAVASIAISDTARALGYKRVKFQEHTHAFTYAANGDTIAATCADVDGKCLLPNHAATLEGLTVFNAVTGQGVAEAQIAYEGRDGTSYAASTAAPTDGGRYTASIAVESRTASVDYSIKVTLAFDSKGGSAVASQALDVGETPTRPADPTKAGSIFGDWYEDESLRTRFDFNNTIAQDKTVYAKWGEHEVAWVVSVGSTSRTVRDVFTGDAPAAASNDHVNGLVNMIQPEGSTLAWKTETDAGNVTYTAQFSYAVALHPNGGATSPTRSHSLTPQFLIYRREIM